MPVTYQIDGRRDYSNKMYCRSDPRRGDRSFPTTGPRSQLFAKHTQKAILLGFWLATAAGQPPAPSVLKATDILSYLKSSIAWYRQVNPLEQTPAFADDVLLRDNTHAAALNAVKLAFDFAKTAISVTDVAPATVPSQPSAAPQGRNLAQATARAAARVENLQTRLADLNKVLDTARGGSRELIHAQRDTVQAELTLAMHVRETVNTLAAFVPTTGLGGLASQIDQLERTVPEVAHQTPLAAASASGTSRRHAASRTASRSAAAVAPFHPESSGIIRLSTELFAVAHNRSQLRDAMSGTDHLLTSLDQIRQPLINDIRALVRRSEDLGTIGGDESVEQLASDRHDIEVLATRFKQLSTVTVPLSEQKIVLGDVRGNLEQALGGINALYSEIGQYLLVRLGILAAVIGAIVLLSSIWRRVSFRYIRDARRRTQFLTLRRVVVACAVTVVVMLNFVSEFGSLATYAGLLTAGIAVALQSVILSVVAYFFLIGHYGVRAGDRVTISGVTGTVIDIGLVRLYLAELAGSGGEWHPTGRVVVYSNSVLFQPSALFKQMPETDYVWHTVRLVLAPETDFKLAEERISRAVDTVYDKYRHGIEQQHAKLEHAVESQITQPQPEVGLHYSDDGLEAFVDYPAQIKHAALTDCEIVKALEDAIVREPRLAFGKAGNPKIVTKAA